MAVILCTHVVVTIIYFQQFDPLQIFCYILVSGPCLNLSHNIFPWLEAWKIMKSESGLEMRIHFAGSYTYKSVATQIIHVHMYRL